MASTKNFFERLRTKNKLSMSEMAKKIGMSQSNYWKLEKGQISLSIAAVEKISTKFEIAPELLLKEFKKIQKARA